MIDVLLGAFLIIISILLYYSFLKGCYEKEGLHAKDILLLAVSVVINTAFAVVFADIMIIKMILSVLLLAIIAKLLFALSVKKSVLMSLIYTGIYISSEMIVFLLIQSIGSNSLSSMTNQSGGFIAELASQLIVLIVVLVLTIVLKKTNLSRMDYKGWIVFTLFPIFTLVTIIILIYAAERNLLGDMIYELLFLSSGLLILNIMQLLLLDNVIERETETRKKEMLIEQATHLNQMYQSLSDEREKQKARSHDYLNHLQVMLMLARDGKINDEIHYIEEQIGKETHSIDVIDTGNTLINAVLNVKYLEAKEKGIVIPFIADNLTNLKISDSDLVTILTNLLDNAIEAVQHCDEKRIIFKIIREHETLYIDSSNRYSGRLPEEYDSFTTKVDKLNHGYGISNIKKAVAANNGQCFIETDKGVFHVTITIPLI